MTHYTKLHVLVDTHLQDDTNTKEQLLWLIQAELNKKEAYQFVLAPHVQMPGKLLRVTLMTAAVETGSKYHRVHAHFTLEVKHNSAFLLTAADGININARMMKWFEAHMPWATSPFVSVKLGDARAENYVAKNE